MEIELAFYALCRYPVYIGRCKSNYHLMSTMLSFDFFVFSASSDNMARLWSVDTGEVKKEYSGHQKAVACLAFRDEIVQ
jgi:WD40 repeat protein